MKLNIEETNDTYKNDKKLSSLNNTANFDFSEDEMNREFLKTVHNSSIMTPQMQA